MWGKALGPNLGHGFLVRVGVFFLPVKQKKIKTNAKPGKDRVIGQDSDDTGKVPCCNFCRKQCEVPKKNDFGTYPVGPAVLQKGLH